MLSARPTALGPTRSIILSLFIGFGSTLLVNGMSHVDTENMTSLMDIEQKRIQVAKNDSFTLACKIQRQALRPGEKFLWLKEHISSDERGPIEQSLLIIGDDSYYLLRSQEPTLKVNQANFFHSGRYYCIVGLESDLMQVNKSLSSNITFLNYRMEPRNVLVYDLEGVVKALKFYRATREYETEVMETFSRYKTFVHWTKSFIFALALICDFLYSVMFITLPKEKNRRPSRVEESEVVTDKIV